MKKPAQIARHRAVQAGACLCALFLGDSYGAQRNAVADTVFSNGFIYTVDAHDSVRQALAVRAGRIVYVGTDAGAAGFIGARTRQVDLHGRMLMPGLVDGHMHPLHGGASLLKCNLNYEQLDTVALQSKIQGCLDDSRAREPDDWLQVVNWFQEGMLPAGVATDHSLLDSLRTSRPIVVFSSFGHSVLVNSRALQLARVNADTPQPLAGKINVDASGKPTGLMDDAAQDLITDKMPAPSEQDNLKAARSALDAMRRQGITTFLDAMALRPALNAFAELQREGALTARAHFALLISPAEGRDPQKAIARVTELARRFDKGPVGVTPTMTVRNVKLFLDGVISAPALSGAMLEPYFAASTGGPWQPGTNRGPDVYFPAPLLHSLLRGMVAAGFEPHMHADGDRAVHEGLDAIQALREAYPGKDVRAALAHDEIVDPADFPRYQALNAIPVLSFQWEKPASDTVDNMRDYLGAARYRYVEPAGYLEAAGARIAYGSDWPVDRLDEWFALKVGVTRENAPGTYPKYAGRLGEDSGLSRQTVLRAITINSSYELHQEKDTGSLEVGKLADLIVLDRNLLTVAPEDMAGTTVLLTVVGGRVVYQSEEF